jgi:general nucleoside transport system permease protein
MTPVRREAIVDTLVHAVLVAVAVTVALAASALLLTVTDATPGQVFSAMSRGSFGSTSSFVTTLNHTAPILTVAIGACLAGRAGMLNIGQEGQFLMGGLGGLLVGLYVPAPRPLLVPLVLVGGALGGALWTAGPAVARYTRGVHEVISTLLLNFLAIQVVSWLVNRQYLLQETLPKGSFSAPTPQTERLPDKAWLWVLSTGRGYRLHAGIVVSLALAVIITFVVRRTPWGFRLRLFGTNPRVAQRAGVRAGRFGGSVLVMSGAFAGIGGAMLLSGVALRVNPGLANNYGWEGLLVALVARYEVPIAALVALLFGALRAGGGALASTGVSPAIVGVVQASIVLAVMLPSLYMRRRQTRRTRAKAQRAQDDAVIDAVPRPTARPPRATAAVRSS